MNCDPSDFEKKLEDCQSTGSIGQRAACTNDLTSEVEACINTIVTALKEHGEGESGEQFEAEHLDWLNWRDKNAELYQYFFPAHRALNSIAYRKAELTIEKLRFAFELEEKVSTAE